MVDVEVAESSDNTAAAKKRLTQRWTDVAMVSQLSKIISYMLDIAKQSMRYAEIIAAVTAEKATHCSPRELVNVEQEYFDNKLQSG